MEDQQAPRSAADEAKVITLCGSTTFEAEFAEVNQRLTMEGCVVLSLGMFSLPDLPDHDWTADSSDLKARLGGVHFQKIRMADEVYIVDPGGYVGESTRREIAYAESLGTPVRYLSRERVATQQLSLEPARMIELADIFALHADERVWRHRPKGRHTSIEHTRTKVTEMEHQWNRDGLGYWVARLRQPVSGLPAGTCVGVGGCAVEGNRGGWNLYYRFRPEAQGHGLATELCQAALEAARSVDAERPVIAILAEENLASKATAERAGLRLQWRGPGRPPDGGVRLVYADRTIDTRELAALLD